MIHSSRSGHAGFSSRLVLAKSRLHCIRSTLGYHVIAAVPLPSLSRLVPDLLSLHLAPFAHPPPSCLFPLLTASRGGVPLSSGGNIPGSPLILWEEEGRGLPRLTLGPLSPGLAVDGFEWAKERDVDQP